MPKVFLQIGASKKVDVGVTAATAAQVCKYICYFICMTIKLLGKPSKCTFFEVRYRTFQNSHIALFRTPISHFSELPYRTFQNYDIALFTTPISHFSELRYRTF